MFQRKTRFQVIIEQFKTIHKKKVISKYNTFNLSEIPLKLSRSKGLNIISS